MPPHFNANELLEQYWYFFGHIPAFGALKAR